MTEGLYSNVSGVIPHSEDESVAEAKEPIRSTPRSSEGPVASLDLTHRPRSVSSLLILLRAMSDVWAAARGVVQTVSGRGRWQMMAVMVVMDTERARS